jgi:hypothetical protein
MHSGQRQGCIPRHEGRGKWATERGKNRCSQGKVGRQASRWADAGMNESGDRQAEAARQR